MASRVEVFADVTCPFTHVGLRKVIDVVADIDGDLEMSLEMRMRAWPLEWVNGEPLQADKVGSEIEALREQLGVDAFADFDPGTWPATTIPAHNLAAAAYETDPSTGLRVSLALRDALFEEGLDVSDPSVLSRLAADHDLEPPPSEPVPSVDADYAEGTRRGVRGSPDFWIGSDEFFCPALTVEHDETGLAVEFDEAGLEEFLTRVKSLSSP